MGSRKKFIDYEALRNLSIVEVAEALGMPIVKTGAGVWCMRDPEKPRDVTSLTIFESNNRWKRFSGVERGGVSSGSTIDLVMHYQNVDRDTAARWLNSQFIL